MVIPRTFVDALKCSEHLATAAAHRLQPIGNGVPAGIREVARSLNARLVRMPAMSTGSGSLRRDGVGWIVAVKDDLDDLSLRGRQIVAHEVAHLLMIQQGMFGPCSEQEYWMLEEACDRVAIKMLPTEGSEGHDAQ